MGSTYTSTPQVLFPHAIAADWWCRRPRLIQIHRTRRTCVCVAYTTVVCYMCDIWWVTTMGYMHTPASSPCVCIDEWFVASHQGTPPAKKRQPDRDPSAPRKRRRPSLGLEQDPGRCVCIVRMCAHIAWSMYSDSTHTLYIKCIQALPLTDRPRVCIRVSCIIRHPLSRYYEKCWTD